jgi:hypothetical protein
MKTGYYGPGDLANAMASALDAALAGRSARESPAPADIAKGFLVATVANTEMPMSDRLHAAALLLQVKP